MPLLDGRYEILSEQSLAPGITQWLATDPEGRSVRIEWFDVAPDDEARFEAYRRLLKALARDGRAAIRDVVARPGARYVAWWVPPDGASRGRAVQFETQIADAGFDAEHSEWRRHEGETLLYALPFRTPEPSSDTRPTRGRKPRWTWTPAHQTWLLSGAITLLALVALLAVWGSRANDRVVVVANVVGQPYADAAAKLNQQRLAVTLIEVANDDVPAGLVVATDPAPGQTLRPGRAVRVSVALPSGNLTPTRVPRLVGLTSADAAAVALQQAGLREGTWVRLHMDAPAGVVMAQSPVAGSTVARGTLVGGVISLGPRPNLTFVPDLKGLQVADAQALARLAGLSDAQVVVEFLAADGVELGTVLAQSLAPYREVVVADAILRLIVAGGALPVASAAGLPALGGMTEAEARAEARGFRIEVRTIAEFGLPDGVVVQSLPVGAQPSDGVLVLTVNVRPRAIPVPRPLVVVRQNEPRALPYLWFIEPGIPVVRADVVAQTLEGERVNVASFSVRGGERVEGVWTTTYPGVVVFELTLNGEPYGTPLRVP